MLILLIGFVVVISMWHRKDLKEQAREIAILGGMRNKYKILIDMILSTEARMKILEEGDNYIRIGFSSIGGRNIFVISENFGKLDIIFSTKNYIQSFEVRRSFNTDSSQKKIFSDLFIAINEKNIQLLK